MNVSTLAVSIASLIFSVVALAGVLGVIAVQIVLLIKVIAASTVYIPYAVTFTYGITDIYDTSKFTQIHYSSFI